MSKLHEEEVISWAKRKAWEIFHEDERNLETKAIKGVPFQSAAILQEMESNDLDKRFFRKVRETIQTELKNICNKEIEQRDREKELRNMQNSFYDNWNNSSYDIPD